MSLKNRITMKRKELGINQTELAKRAGLTPPSISQYESGVRNPSYDAILKLASALGVNANYLISGIETNNNHKLDPISEVLIKIMQNLSNSKKEQIIDYTLLSLGQKKHVEFYSTDPQHYSKYVYEQYFNKTLPINADELADKLNIKIIRGEISEEADAILLKKNNTIIINNELQYEPRIKFALITLIGHLILPWHVEDIYYYRKPGKSTLLTDKTEEMEATQFTTNLITPPEELEKDLSIYKTKHADLKNLKKLAEEKYQVSLTSLCNRLVELYSDRFATITSNNYIVTKVFANNVPVIKNGASLDERSKAFELLEYKGEREEFKEGMVEASAWVDSTLSDELIYESSVFNPDYNSVYTLITKANK